MDTNSPNFAIGRGRLFAELANAVSDAINAALKLGMEADEAACCVVTVAADYARHAYGDTYLNDLALVVKKRAGRALPENIP